MTSALFRRQLAAYASVHRDRRNKATHFVGIPVIVFSLLPILALQPTLLLVVAVVAVLGWLALDFGIGAVMAVTMAIACYAAGALASALGSTQSVWIAFLTLFVGGWILQFLGHHYEGKRPALIDNIFQAFVGPMFLVAEIMVVSGQRRDLAQVMHQSDVTAR